MKNESNVDESSSSKVQQKAKEIDHMSDQQAKDPTQQSVDTGPKTPGAAASKPQPK
jgi:hypothetical protein